MLFIDARHIFRQIDRAHRDFRPEQIEFLANIVRLYRGEDVETSDGSAALIGALPRRRLRDVPRPVQGRHVDEIEAQGWSLNPGRYTGTTVDDGDGDFAERLAALHAEFTNLSDEAGAAPAS